MKFTELIASQNLQQLESHLKRGVTRILCRSAAVGSG